MRRAFLIPLVLLIYANPLHAQFEHVLRYSEVEAAAIVPGTENQDSDTTDGFEDFDNIAATSAAHALGTASATASQRSSLRDELGRVFVQGGSAATETGVGASGASSHFLYRFRNVGGDLPVRVSWAIAQTGAGDVGIRFWDAAEPDMNPILLAQRASGVSTGPLTAIEDIVVTSGSSYDLRVHGFIPGGETGTTSFTFTLTPVPEPAAFPAVIAGWWLVGRRRRPSRCKQEVPSNR